MKEWQIDPETGAFYDPTDAPIKLSTTESTVSNQTWLWLIIGAAVLLALRNR